MPLSWLSGVLSLKGCLYWCRGVDAEMRIRLCWVALLSCFLMLGIGWIEGHDGDHEAAYILSFHRFSGLGFRYLE